MLSREELYNLWISKKFLLGVIKLFTSQDFKNSPLLQGKVVQRGTHHQLIEDPNSLYTHLWESQNQTAYQNSVSEDDSNLQ